MLVSTARDWGNVVRDRRAALGLTQEALGELIGRTRQWVIRFENGHAGSANIESLLRIVDALGLAIEVSADDPEEDPDPMFLNPDIADPWDDDL